MSMICYGTTRRHRAFLSVCTAALFAVSAFIASGRAEDVRSAAEAATGATATPAGALQILAVRAEAATTKPDWSFHHAALRHAILGRRTTLSAYVKLGTPLPSSPVSIVLVLALDGRLLLRSTTTGIPPGDGTGEIWHHTDFVPQQVGTYDLWTHVEVNGTIVQAKRTTFQVTRPSQPFVLHFSSLTIANAAQQQARAFRRTDRVFIRASWSETGTPSGSEAAISEELQYPGATGWQTLGRPLVTSFDTTDGLHTFTFSFVPQTQYASLRVLLHITVGTATQTRSAVIAVT